MPDKAIFGRYWPADSPVHRMDPRVKLVLSLAFMVAVFCARTYAGLGVAAAFVAGAYALARIPFGQALRSIGPLLFIVVVTALLNVFFVQGGTVYFQWWVFCISEAGLSSAAFVACRLLLLLLGVSLLTLATTALDITDAFEHLLSPFARIGLPAHELGMMMGIALRFLPQLAFELACVYRAQISRGATFSGSLKGRARMLASRSDMRKRSRPPWRRAATTAGRGARGCIPCAARAATRWAWRQWRPCSRSSSARISCRCEARDTARAKRNAATALEVAGAIPCDGRKNGLKLTWLKRT